MAERRMFAKTIIDSDAFLDMQLTTQALYFHLSMRADDDGFVNNPQRIMRVIGSTKNDFDLLLAKGFIIPFESGICVIKHWRIHNYLRSDRYKPTNYKEEKSMLRIKENGAYTLDDSAASHRYTVGIPMVDAGKDSIGKVRQDDDSACARDDVERLRAFCEKWDISIDTNSSYILNLDFEKLDKAYAESISFLQNRPFAKTLSWIVKNQSSIIAGKYKELPKLYEKSIEDSGTDYDNDPLNAAFDKLNEEL